MPKQQYPDISDILDRKERGRHVMARLSFAEKLDLLDRLRENEKSLGAVMREAFRRVGEQEKS
jgi:hypothetical protein